MFELRVPVGGCGCLPVSCGSLAGGIPADPAASGYCCRRSYGPISRKAAASFAWLAGHPHQWAHRVAHGRGFQQPPHSVFKQRGVLLGRGGTAAAGPPDLAGQSSGAAKSFRPRPGRIARCRPHGRCGGDAAATSGFGFRRREKHARARSPRSRVTAVNCSRIADVGRSSPESHGMGCTAPESPSMKIRSACCSRFNRFWASP